MAKKKTSKKRTVVDIDIAPEDLFWSISHIMTCVAAGVGKQGQFLRTFADAYSRADGQNKALLFHSALSLVVKYNLWTDTYIDAKRPAHLEEFTTTILSLESGVLSLKYDVLGVKVAVRDYDIDSVDPGTMLDADEQPFNLLEFGACENVFM